MAIPTDLRYVITASATGARHAMTVAERDSSSRAVCGSAATMPSAAALAAPGVDVTFAAVTLNDLHLTGLVKVCQSCRVRVSVLALEAPAGDLEEEADGQLVVAVPGAPVGSLDLRPTLF